MIRKISLKIEKQHAATGLSEISCTQDVMTTKQHAANEFSEILCHVRMIRGNPRCNIVVLFVPLRS